MGAVLTVERPIVELGGKLRESKAKTRAGKRRVFLDHDTAGLLREHRKAQLKLRLKAGEAWADNETYVLTLFSPEGRTAKSQLAGNSFTAGQAWWGGWGSNPRPADYESAALTC